MTQATFDEVQEARLSAPPARHFLPTPPFFHAKRFAAQHGCDLAIPNGEGIGNILMFTPLVEAMARAIGRPLRILTAPITVMVGDTGDELYPIWRNNPFVSEIVDADAIDTEIMQLVRCEQDNLCLFGHAIESICLVYGLLPRVTKPSLYLTAAEMQWAMQALRRLPRPLVCLHPGGTSSSPRGTPWYSDRWCEIIEALKTTVGFVQVAKWGFDSKCLPVLAPQHTLRQTMAVIWASDIFVGFDSSPAHMATAFDKPALVLWDVERKSLIEDRHHIGFAPASMLRWSYPQNRNIMLLGERDKEIAGICMNFIRDTSQSFHHQMQAPFPHANAQG